MIIGIQRGLDQLKEQLKERGYYIVEVDQYRHPIDAYVYTATQADGILENLAVTNQVYTGPEPYDSQSSMGVLMVNAYNKTVEEIEQILRERVYTPLF
ncbi:MAG: hypothetical protein GX962_02235 [Epulopiscium sp.]|nr:hypothetical protein [Candidatus Epulonipiscium sp.]